MTDKSRRQRGSRTHGGGSQKNRRGAGNRGGRGNAGRKDHEIHGKEPLGKHGFTQPPAVQDEVETINIRKLDENASFYAQQGKAEEYENGYRIDARDVVGVSLAEGASKARCPHVKVLGGGRVHTRLEVIADEFSDSAIDLIESEDGEAIRAPLGSVPAEDKTSKESGDKTMTVDKEPRKYLSEKRTEVSDGRVLTYDEIDVILELGEIPDHRDSVYEILEDHVQNSEDIEPKDVVTLYRISSFAKEYGFEVEQIENRIEDYFEDMDTSEDRKEQLRYGVSDSLTPEQVREGLRSIEAKAKEIFGTIDNGVEEIVTRQKKNYLIAIRGRLKH